MGGLTPTFTTHWPALDSSDNNGNTATIPTNRWAPLCARRNKDNRERAPGPRDRDGDCSAINDRQFGSARKILKTADSECLRNESPSVPFAQCFRFASFLDPFCCRLTAFLDPFCCRLTSLVFPLLNLLHAAARLQAPAASSSVFSDCCTTRHSLENEIPAQSSRFTKTAVFITEFLDTTANRAIGGTSFAT